MSKVVLKGIGWDHARGYESVKAVTDLFMQNNPDIEVVWDKHSLHDFAFRSLEELAAKYDLIILDHPHVGDAFMQQCLLPLDEYPEELGLADLEQDSVGPSFRTYRYGGRLWGLPLDAASQVAVFREAELSRLGFTKPRTIKDLETLGGHPGVFLAMAFRNVHALMALFTVCANMGFPPFSIAGGGMVPEHVGVEALDVLRRIYALCPPESIEWDSMTCLQRMTEEKDLVYCPYVYGFSNYSAPERGEGRLTFTDIPSVGDTEPRGSSIGGAGLAISRRTGQLGAALAFARYIMGREGQRRLALADGQPGRRSVWLDEEVNAKYNNFYRGTLRTLELAYERPRYPRYITFQWEASLVVEDYLRKPSDPSHVIREIERLHREYYDPSFDLR